MLECPNCEIPVPGFACRECGWSLTKATSVTPKTQETHLPARIPTYPEPTAEEDLLIRAQIAIVNELLGITPEDLVAPVSRLPTVDPAIRVRVESTGPVPIAALVDAKMGELKGAPR